MAGSYDEGDLIRLSAAFTDLNDAAVDPTTVTVKHKTPDGTITTKVYLTDAEVIKDSTGNYHIDVSVATYGVWRYRWIGTGAAQAAAEAEFLVAQSEF